MKSDGTIASVDEQHCRRCGQTIYGASVWGGGIGPCCMTCWHLNQNKPTREQRLEAALREIERATHNLELCGLIQYIRDKCREALTTGEGE